MLQRAVKHHGIARLAVLAAQRHDFGTGLVGLVGDDRLVLGVVERGQLDVRGDGGVDSTVGTLTVGSILSGRVTVGGTTNTVLASGATLDLSANTAPFVQPATMTFAGAVNIVLPADAEGRGRQKLISWSEPPAEGVTFAAVGGLPRNMKFDARGDGLYLHRPGLVLIVK